MSAFAVRMAHKSAMKLLDRSQAIWQVFEALRSDALAAADAARVRELAELRERLRDCRDEAEQKLVPHLEEFACVNDKPVEVNGFTVASAHKAALKVAEWAAAPMRGPDRVKAFLDEFYDEGKAKIDWDAVHKQKHAMLLCLMQNDWHDDWAEHRAMLEIELAKALRLPPMKRAEPKLTEKEQVIVTALGYETMQYKQLAARAELKPNSELRKKLVGMVRRGLLDHDEGGYSLGPLLS